jgi:uncharacterized protein (DUF608 family)
MDRREFFRKSAAGVSGLTGLAGANGLSPLQTKAVAQTRRESSNANRLFPINLPNGEWVQFRAAGYAESACGVIYRRGDQVQHGMPLGGVSTGFLDIETNGTFGLASIFNSGVPLVTGPWRAPFLGINTGGRTWVLTLDDTLVGAANAEDIHYWGHYPILDMEYETASVVSVGLRAWTPFIPGDAHLSNTPAAVFEVHLRNTATTPRKGSLAFNFPGPTQAEAQIGPDSPREAMTIGWEMGMPVATGAIPADRKEITAGEFRGLSVSSEKGTGYTLGVIGGTDPIRFGGALWTDGYDFESGRLWGAIGKQLPKPAKAEFSSSMAVDFSLDPGESKVVRILLTWYSPIWKGEGSHYFKRMYTQKYKDAVDVARTVAADHTGLLKRVLAWQQAVYSADEYPVWLRESLVNILHLVTKTGYWAAAQAPIGDWCKEQDGLFGMNECPRECPQIECIPCSFYGNIPVVYFFPELALSTLRGYKAYQYPDGAAPWVFGGCTSGAAEGYRATDGTEMATPSPGYQTTLNGPCYVDMVDRYWQRTGNDEVLKEFYASVKKNTIYTMNLRKGPDGVASVPDGNRNPTQPHGRPGTGLDWFEGNGFFGMTPHVAGIHLAHLRIVRRMAERMGDKAFVSQCDDWLRQGSSSVENKLWAGSYYLNYFEPESGKKSDLVFGYQLDGDWMCFYHGLPGVFQTDRARKTLDTIKNTCVALTPYGAANFANPDGTAAASEQFMAEAWGLDYGSYGYFPPEVFMLGATYLYQGQRETGMELVKNCMHGIVKWGYTWTQPNIVNGATGKRVYGSDYYQNLMLWIVPAAIKRQDLASACGPESLVEKVIRAGKRV